ncbi:MAG: hypothetical protein AAFR23_03565 [Pseudomonadota bacterium]
MTAATARQTVDPETEYKAIEQTLLESPRGRWFLSEHGRRARRLDSLTLHDAISKLQTSLREPPALLGQLRTEIEGLQKLLRETRDALVAKQTALRAKAEDSTAASSSDPMASTGGPAPAAHILNVAEQIHELAWDLQSQEINVEAAEKIARQASHMYALSHRHAVESERVKALTDTLDGALHRLDGLLETVALEAQLDTYNPVPDEPSRDVPSPLPGDDAEPSDTSSNTAA